MAGPRFLAYAFVATLAAACSSPAAQERTGAAELAAVAPLRTQYSGVVMGFDIRRPNTLIVSLDLQSYIDMDDDAVTAMQRNVLRRWRAAWSAAHPHAHAVLHVRFIDFIGRKVADESTTV
ncbi:MAG TPA: hypothetical protein VKR56_14510 [Candidatus Cybelea sp.]|nr:hypothetical protein [Candidatus Cybelea sp.]